MPQQERETNSKGPNRLQTSVRTMLILVMAFASGVITTFLLCSTVAPLVQAVLGGVMSTAGTLKFFDKITNPAK